MHRTSLAILLCGLMMWGAHGRPSAQTAVATESERAGCEALLQTRNLTITYAGIATTRDGTPYCYVKGILPPAIQFHAQLPFPGEWNGRFLKCIAPVTQGEGVLEDGLNQARETHRSTCGRLQ